MLDYSEFKAKLSRLVRLIHSIIWGCQKQFIAYILNTIQASKFTTFEKCHILRACIFKDLMFFATLAGFTHVASCPHPPYRHHTRANLTTWLYSTTHCLLPTTLNYDMPSHTLRCDQQPPTVWPASRLTNQRTNYLTASAKLREQLRTKRMQDDLP